MEHHGQVVGVSWHVLVGRGVLAGQPVHKVGLDGEEQRHLISDPLTLGQLLVPAEAEERLRIFQIGGVEALGEPTIDRREQIARRCPPALFAP